MVLAIAYLKTAQGRKYLAQLCKHFAHRIEVTYDETHGECHFASGTGVLDADDSGLRMEASSVDAKQLGQTQAIIESHLLRFAFREEFEALDWKNSDQAD